MRRFLVVCLLLPMGLFAQPDSLVYNQLEQELLRPGSLLRIRTDSLSELGQLIFTEIRVEDLHTGRQQRGLLIDIAANSYDGYSNWPGRCLLDSLGAAGLLQAVGYFKEALRRKDLTRVETYSYRSRNDVCVILENRFEYYNRWFLTVERRYHRQPRSVPETSAVVRAVKAEDIDRLTAVLRLFLSRTP